MEFITIQVSAKLFSGFRYEIPKTIIDKMSSDEIVAEVKTHMKNFFSKPHDLWILRENIEKLQLHLHDDAPFIKPIIYICDHDHQNSV